MGGGVCPVCHYLSCSLSHILSACLPVRLTLSVLQSHPLSGFLSYSLFCRLCVIPILQKQDYLYLISHKTKSSRARE